MRIAALATDYDGTLACEGVVSPVVVDALRELRAKEDPAEEDTRELAELLLPAVRGPHRPLTDRDFDQLRQRARRKPRRRITAQESR